MDLQLAGKNAVVTGGAGGIGTAICALLAEEGANVVVSDLALERAEAVAEQCRAKGVRAHALLTDLTRPADCAALVDRTVDLLGSADVLVNNAGLWPTHLVTEIPLDEWHRTIDVNLTAVFLTCQRFVALNVAQGRKAKILNVTSQAAFNGSTTGHAHYAAAKAGVVTFTISLSREVASKGINVNALALGMVATSMNRDVLSADRAYYEKRIQIGRIARPDEVARFAVFLVSSAADYFTGATYDATGGMISR
jgi:3-oxoacyl-[acyl-carrier protein] reductase